MANIELGNLDFGAGKYVPDGLGGKVERKNDLIHKSMREAENNTMPPDDVIDQKVKEVLLDKQIEKRLQLLTYLFDRTRGRIAEFWIRYSYDTQAEENRELTGWEPLPETDGGVMEIIHQYYHEYFDDTFLTNTGKLGGKLEF